MFYLSVSPSFLNCSSLFFYSLFSLLASFIYPSNTRLQNFHVVERPVASAAVVVPVQAPSSPMNCGHFTNQVRNALKR